MNRFVLFVLLFLFWVGLTWPTEMTSTYSQDVVVGLLVAALVSRLVGTNTTARPWLSLRRYGWAAVYVVVLGYYIIQANLDVAYRVLHPAMPIRPGIVRIKTRLKRPAARTALCNSITLTPGTLAVDLHDDGTMMVHWINVRSTDAIEAAEQVIGRFEWFIERIFE